MWTVIHYLWQFCHNLLCPTVTFGLILHPCSRVREPHTNMFYDWICPLTDENITFSKTPAVYEDPCLLQDPFGLRRSLPSPRPFRSTKILAFSETPSVYEDPVPVPEILLVPGPSVHLSDSPSFITTLKYSLTGHPLIFPTDASLICLPTYVPSFPA